MNPEANRGSKSDQLRQPNSSLPPDLVNGTLPRLDDASIAIVKSFDREIDSRIQGLSSLHTVVELGRVEYGPHEYPLYRVQTFREYDPALPTILTSGLVHGDEPAGALALLEFLESDILRYRDSAQCVAYPCQNPSGFEANTLETMRLANLNRLWGSESPPEEIAIVQKDLVDLGLKFDITLDLHESPPYYIGEGYDQSDNPRGTWIYESNRDPGKHIGRRMVDTLPADIEPCDWDLIYHDKNERGVVPYLPETTGNAIYAESTTFDGYVFDRYCGHNFTTETPTGWSLEKRIRTHLHYLNCAFQAAIARHGK